MNSKNKTLIILMIAFLFGALSFWKLFEYDIFWQIRYGAEILSGKAVQTVEMWSYTANGSPFINHEWFSTVLVAWLSNLGTHLERLVILRGVLVSAWVFLALRLIQDHLSKKFLPFVLQVFGLASLIYVICSFRFQMRPDLFAAVHFALLVSLWRSKFSAVKKSTWGLILVWSWSNFHIGTAPIGIFFQVCALLFCTQEVPLKAKLGWTFAACFAWFATPLGWKAFEALWLNLGAYDDALVGNPDFQPLSFKLFSYHEAGWCFILWAFYTCIAAWEVLKAAWNRENNWKFDIIIFCSLTLMTMIKIRGIHYQVFFLLPWVADFIERVFNSQKHYARYLAYAGLLIISLWILPDQVNAIARPIGFQLDAQFLPVETVRVIQSIHPLPHLLNPYPFGGYVDLFLPEYSAAIDGRGVPFYHFLREQKAAASSPDRYADFLRRYDINVALDQVPSMIQATDGSMTDTHSLSYPRTEWALVGFDDSSTVYLRRRPEHQEAILKYEYHYIQRGLPPTFGASFNGLSQNVRDQFESEINRCFNSAPRIIYCAIGKAAFLKNHGKITEALDLLKQTEQEAPNEATLLVEYAQQAEVAGMPELAQRLRKHFEKLTLLPINEY